MRCRPEHYFAAARERFTQAVLLRREAEFGLALYVGGLSAECMVRAFIPAGAVFDEGHDVVALFKRATWATSSRQRRQLDAALSQVRSLWNNAYRFADVARIEAYLREQGLDRGLHRGARVIKVRCGELLKAAGVIIEAGSHTWRI